MLSPDNCEMHEELCRLPMSSGKLTYVDKTFAPDYPAAKRIFDAAQAGRDALLLHLRAAVRGGIRRCGSGERVRGELAGAPAALKPIPSISSSR